MTMKDKYNMLVNEIAKKTVFSTIRAKDFNLEPIEFREIITEIEDDELFKSGIWEIEIGSYGFNGLTFKGQVFIENNDKKEFYKNEKTEINYHYHNSITTNVDKNNYGDVMIVNKNTIKNSEFESKFLELLEVINNSNLEDKNIFIRELKIKKNNQEALSHYMTKNLLSKVVEVSTVVSAISGLLGLMQ